MKIEYKHEFAEVFKPFYDMSGSVPRMVDCRFKGIWGGRGSGKSHFMANMMIEMAIAYPKARMVCVREYQSSLKESVYQLLIDKINAQGLDKHFRVQKDRIITPGGGYIIFRGMQEYNKDTIKSLEGFLVCWVEEAQTMSSGSLEMLRPTIRGCPEYPHKMSEIWFSWNPRSKKDPVDRLLRAEKPAPSSIVVKANYYDNPWLNKELKLERELDELTSGIRYNHIWLGDYEPSVIGALWNRDLLDNQRIKPDQLPEMEMIVVGVDPAGMSSEKLKRADLMELKRSSTGISVVGRGKDGNGYIIADMTIPAGPEQWGEKAVAAYRFYDADYFVVEDNYGGDMVRGTIHSVWPQAPIVSRNAQRSKQDRAEPIASLFSLNKFFIAGNFSDLETQMCLITPDGYMGPDGSPNNLDAFVWAAHSVMGGIIRESSKGKLKPTRKKMLLTSKRSGQGWMR